ncbi:MAG TPA: hypothetical protein VFS18_04865 [Actinomycetota bacterium]|nr:hypothetical protein [Actinomycetota bacterium]
MAFDLELTACPCSLPAEVAARFDIEEDSQTTEYSVLYCIAGHSTVMPTTELPVTTIGDIRID